MRGQKGQASILIAIIFQLLFVFFAMVINVGLLVHDKINLQNSTDIAAYYAAMKQAEVLNSMAQLNYQIHQSWKLFNWRVWALGDAGRNEDYLNSGSITALGADSPAKWKDAQRPIICITHPLWKDVRVKGQNAENLCAKTNLTLKSLNPPGLIGAQGVFAGVFSIFINGISDQNSHFHDDFKNTGSLNYEMAATFLGSYKNAVARRRFAIHALQKLLIASQTDFQDLSGSSVKNTTQTTLLNNLTASNKANGGPTFEFQNGLGGRPFMVPIDVRVFLTYLDFENGANATTSSINQINVGPIGNKKLADDAEPFWYSDYSNGTDLESAQQFNEEVEVFDGNPKAYYSLVGFEKNPWTLAYVRVAATTHPKMLFSPLTGTAGITLTAESYAMPFGGKMGPWYFDGWPNNADNSMSSNRVEGSLTVYAPRRDDPSTSVITALPNYSRFPGDKYGMSSRLARKVGLTQIEAKPPNFSDYFSSTAATSIVDPMADPLVASPPNSQSSIQLSPPLRNAEKGAVAPDIFDATYYSVAYDFSSRYQETNQYLYSKYCGLNNNMPSCFDLGNELPPLVSSGGAIPSPISTIFYNGKSPDFSPNTDLWTGTPPFWILTKPQHLNTSWSQGDPGEYDASQAAKSVGATWSFPDNPTDKPAGGRAGYSVKLVSKQFLLSKKLPLGGSAGPGGIWNPPQP